ncbi:uncharacterized protein LOC111803119 [Cucurbita pepo subsp. pepo]|uniref:uncharacterized protein LOC111803119 n=1 Tax=Cucurbita pepo subsp. pepo TaxID=3664 RepID=UPI000C9D53B1|nr:uncharacterized protein LOC111803119 [Cucurbita pepo subsp. pepo]
MPAIADKLEPLSVGTTGRRYELVEDVVIEVSTQFKLESYSAPNSAYSSPPLGSGAAAKKKVHDGGRGLNRSKSCGEGRGRALPHGLIENRVMIWEKGHKHKTEEGKARRFRCGALCLLLPVLGGLGFKVGKGKEERKEEVEEGEEGGGCISISISHSRVSLEKFECGSWASSGMVAHEDGESMSGMGSLYFDLPMELIRNSVGARTQSPAQTAFVFDRDGVGVHHLPVWTKAKLAEESGAASPCVITPRLRRAREEFNALLEAH